MKKESESSVFSSLKDLLSLRRNALSVGLKTDKKNISLNTGSQRSFLKTKGMNFEEVRPYQQGDDSRQIDWRVTAKHGKPFTKVYVDDTVHQVYVLTDLQNQMFFASHGDFKSVVAVRVNALVSWIVLNKKGVLHQIVLSNQGVKSFKPIQIEENLTAFFKQLLKMMPRTNNSQTSFLTQGVQTLKKQLKTGSIVFIISDFREISTDFVKEIREMGKSHSIILMHIFDGMEEKLPAGLFSFSDGISRFSLDTRLKSVQNTFTDIFKKRQETLQQMAKKTHAIYVPLQTHEDYISQVLQILNKRGMLYGK